jgi:ubiquinone/menaquinone biosynthesis C-methylase UbiE
MRRPRFIAEQARHASGLLGRVIAIIMARETWSQNLRAIAALDIRAGDCVLDIGCGHGRSLGELAAQAPNGHVVGVDPSELMAQIALSSNRALVDRKRVEIAVADASSLPYWDATFDKALCVHVIYFWEDVGAALREIARVLKPGGRLALTFRTNADRTAVASFPSEVYRFPAYAEVAAALNAAGLATSADADQHFGRAGPVLLVAVKRARQPEPGDAYSLPSMAP